MIVTKKDMEIFGHKDDWGVDCLYRNAAQKLLDAKLKEVGQDKKDFISLADTIREHNRVEQVAMGVSGQFFSEDHLQTLADFCKSQNPSFDREKWLGYINGDNGPNGGKR